MYKILFQSKNIDIQAKGGKVISLGTLQGNADIHVSQESVSKISSNEECSHLGAVGWIDFIILQK